MKKLLCKIVIGVFALMLIAAPAAADTVKLIMDNGNVVRTYSNVEVTGSGFTWIEFKTAGGKTIKLICLSHTIEVTEE